MSEEKSINKKAIELMTAKSFDKLYFEKLRDTEIKTNEAAYNAAEEVYKQYFNRTRYSSFDSFRVSKNKRLKVNSFKNNVKNEIKLINKKAIELMTAKGFDKLYFEKLKDININSNKEAYEATEMVYSGYFGKTRYSDYDSYRRSKNRRLKVKN